MCGQFSMEIGAHSHLGRTCLGLLDGLLVGRRCRMWALVGFGMANISGEMVPDGSIGRPDARGNRASEGVRFLVPREAIDGCSTLGREEGEFGRVRRIEGGMGFLAWL